MLFLARSLAPMWENGFADGGYAVMGCCSGLNRGPCGEDVNVDDVEVPLRSESASGY